MGDLNIVVRALPELQAVLIAWVTLFVLYLLLRRLLYKPVSKILNDRQAKIQANIEEAKNLRQEAEAIRLDYETRIDHAKKESQEIIESGRKRGDEIKNSILEEARQEAKAIVERARKDIALEKEKAYEDIKKSTGEMAILIASKIMEENITIENQNNLIDKFIDEAGSSKWQN